LKIPQGQSESIFERRTDNTMYKRTRTKGQTTIYKRRVWRYQRVNQNPYIEEEQTTQWTKEKVQKDKQRSTKEEFEDTKGLIRIRI
jgi:tetrahydrodipicolinate N-succinyltransferase